MNAANHLAVGACFEKGVSKLYCGVSVSMMRIVTVEHTRLVLVVQLESELGTFGIRSITKKSFQVGPVWISVVRCANELVVNADVNFGEERVKKVINRPDMILVRDGGSVTLRYLRLDVELGTTEVQIL